MMANYYTTGRYPTSAIRFFTRNQTNLFQAIRLRGLTLVKHEVGGGTETNELGSIDLLFCFADDEQQRPALGFRELELKEGEGKYMYALIYIDPSLLNLWVGEMDREREEE